jgi:O-acetyl-ADP-ribose deacetylase (regulator of RNase III)
MFRIVRGDLVAMAVLGEFDAIIHGCNCFCTMGAGIARQIAQTFPLALKKDKRTKRGDIAKLGTFSSAVFANGFTIYNAYTQFQFGKREQYVDYAALEKALKAIAADITKLDARVGLPKIGAGLGGGNWETIKDIIQEVFSHHTNVTVVEWAPEEPNA